MIGNLRAHAAQRIEDQTAGFNAAGKIHMVIGF